MARRQGPAICRFACCARRRGLINLIGEIDADAAKQAGVRAVEFGMEYDTEDLEEIARLAASGSLKSHITKVLPLDKAREALDLNQGGNSHGKIILQVA